MSRKERKSYNQGKRDGYLEGYAIGYAQAPEAPHPSQLAR